MNRASLCRIRRPIACPRTIMASTPLLKQVLAAGETGVALSQGYRCAFKPLRVAALRTLAKRIVWAGAGVPAAASYLGRKLRYIP